MISRVMSISDLQVSQFPKGFVITVVHTQTLQTQRNQKTLLGWHWMSEK